MSERKCPGHGPGGEAGTTFFGDPGRCPDCLRAEVAELERELADADERAAANGARAANLDELLGASMRANLKDAVGWAARVAEAQAEVERLRKETVPQNAHDLLSAGMGRSEELRSELKQRCRELEALLKPFADAYAAAVGEFPHTDRLPGSVSVGVGIPIRAWRAAHRALNPPREGPAVDGGHAAADVPGNPDAFDPPPGTPPCPDCGRPGCGPGCPGATHELGGEG